MPSDSWWGVRQRLLLAAADRDIERLGHLTGDVGLNLEHVGDRGVERLLPAGVSRWPPRSARGSPAPGSHRPLFSQRTFPTSR